MSCTDERKSAYGCFLQPCDQITTNQRLTSITTHKATVWWKLNAVGNQTRRPKGSVWRFCIFQRQTSTYLSVQRGRSSSGYVSYKCLSHRTDCSMAHHEKLRGVFHFIWICVFFLFYFNSHLNCRKYSISINISNVSMFICSCLFWQNVWNLYSACSFHTVWLWLSYRVVCSFNFPG